MKLKYYSEELDELFDTEEELKKAEDEAKAADDEIDEAIAQIDKLIRKIIGEDNLKGWSVVITVDMTI